MSTNARTIPSAAPKSVSTFTILSNGKPIPRSMHVLSIVVSKEVNRIPWATVLLQDGEASSETFDVSNQPEFEPGVELEIHTGYRSQEEPVFKGIVIRHGIKVRKNASVLVVEAKDPAVKMTTQLRNRYFAELADSDLIEQLLADYGLESDVEATSITHHELVQANVSDWDFMLCRADVSGLFVIAHDGRVEVKKPDLAQEAVLTAQFGATVKELDAEIDARHQYSGVVASAWSPADQALAADVEAEDPTLPKAGNLTPAALAAVTGEDPWTLRHSGRILESELKAWADAKLVKQRLAKIRGQVRTDGTAEVTPGKIIRLAGAGERFEGDLFVSGVRHEVQKGVWETVIQFGLDPQWFAETFDLEQPAAGAMLPPVEGLQIGVVTALADDPDGEERIKVRIPVIHDADEGAWARIATLDAGSNRGTVFRPEIGDEVVVGFIQRDPRHAVILGMVHSSANAAPIPASDDNHEKAYVSRSELKLHFNDDTKVVTLSTKAGNQLVLSEDQKAITLQDQHGNKIVMDQSGIQIESIKDVKITATGNLTAEGVNATLKGSGQLTAEGGGSAEFKSGGNTALKGSMVQIN
jgi:Rhs element Vgr protein